MSETKLSNLLIIREAKDTSNRFFPFTMENKLINLFLCDYATADKDGKLSASGIFDRVNLNEGQPIVTNFFVAAQFQVEDDKGIGTKPASISIETPSGNTNVKIDFTIDGGSEKIKRLNILAQFSLVKFSEPGIHLVKVIVDGKIVGEPRPFEVK